MYFTGERTVSEKKQSVNRHVGEKIRAIRTANAMTQTEFINSLELKGGKTLISQVEHGKKPLPSSVLPIIAEQGNVTVESLFRDAGSGGSIIGTLLGSMQVSHRDKDALISYMNPMLKNAEKRMGPARLLDIICGAVVSAAESEDADILPFKMNDQMYRVSKYNYTADHPSMFIEEARQSEK